MNKFIAILALLGATSATKIVFKDTIQTILSQHQSTLTHSEIQHIYEQAKALKEAKDA